MMGVKLANIKYQVQKFIKPETFTMSKGDDMNLLN